MVAAGSTVPSGLRLGHRGRGGGGLRLRPAGRRWPEARRSGHRGCGRGGRSGRGAGRALDRQPLLDAVEAGHHTLGAVVGAGEQHAGADQLEQQPRSGGALELGETVGDQLGGAAEVRPPEAGRLRGEPLPLVLRYVDQAGRRGVGDGRDDHQVPEPAQQVLGEAARVLPGLDHLVDDAEHGPPVTGGEGVDHLVQQGVGGEAQQRGGQVVGHPLGAGAAHQLVEHRERVPRRPAAGPDHERQRGRVDRDPLAVAQLAEVVRQRARRDQPERVVVGPGPDRADHLVGLGGREDELEVLGWLLDELQQRVEALRRHHVRLVDDVDLVAAVDRGEERPLPQVTGVVDAAVAGGVDLDHVDGARAAAGQVGAGAAHPARLVGRALLAVEAAGQDPGAGGLAAAARPGEEVGVVDPVVVERRPQRGRDVVLADDLGERLRPVAAVEGEGCFHA